MPFTYPLDENNNLVLKMDIVPKGDAIRARLFSRYSPDKSRAARNLLAMLNIHSKGETFTPDSQTFTIPLDPKHPDFNIDIADHQHAAFTIEDGEIVAHHQPSHKLSVIQTRMLGRSNDGKGMPLLVDNPDILTPITDLHTHMSGQITAHDLMEIGLKHDVAYPLAALRLLGLQYPKEGHCMIPKREFLPLKHLQLTKGNTEEAIPLRMLSAPVRERLAHALSFSPESQCTYEEMEICYYLREPFTKDVKLLPDVLTKIAEDYQRQGIQYAELSSNAVLDPTWLKVVHEVMPAIEKKTGVQLRFLAGFPRNISDEDFEKRIERFKAVAASPYIAGVDLLGYEINKTSSLEKHLNTLAEWIGAKHPELIMRIHAGENPKNSYNVDEAIDLTRHHNVRLRIGHAVHGIDSNVLHRVAELAGQNLAIEFNPDSNLCCNNIDDPKQVPVNKFLEHDADCVMGSDGAGLYRTNAKQIAMAAALCGVNTVGFQKMRETELEHIKIQDDIFKQKMKTLPKNFFKTIPKPSKPVQKLQAEKTEEPPLNTPSLDGFIRKRAPIFIGGASGNDWLCMPPQKQDEFRHGLHLLLNHLDPKKVCFMIGRTKHEGADLNLVEALVDYNNESRNKKKFDCVRILAQTNPRLFPDMPGIHHTHLLDTPLLFLPSKVVHFLRDHNGASILVGGKSFTSDIILQSQKQDDAVPTLIMADVPGASGSKAKIYPDIAFHNAVEMVEKFYAQRPELFTHAPNRNELRGEYEQLKIADMRGKTRIGIAH
ncbi:MAG: hypothetical protein SFT92_06360 [Rickettsiales bacterium]|nr:hypothetical protein [Rickettsiales bacterium]